MNKKILAMLLAAAMTLSLAACSSSSDSSDSSSSSSSSSDSSSSTSSSDGDTIKIALIANTTGDYAMYGIPVANGAKLYIDEVNAAGGINGKQIEVLEYDDKGDGLESVNSFYLALDNGATAVIGSVLTGATIALADETYLENVPQITASATSALVTQFEEDSDEIRENVFRSCFIDPFQGEKMADYAVNALGAKTAAVFYETGSDYSEGLKDAFIAKAAELGLEIVATEAFPTGDKAYNTQMSNIAAVQPDVIFAPFYYSEAGLAITQARQAGVTGIFMGGDGFGSISQYAEAADLEGTVYCSGYAPGTDSVVDFETAYEAAYGEAVPNMFAPLAYDAAMLMCAALAEAEAAGLETGSSDYMQAVIDALAANDGTEGITGSYTFDGYNNPIKSAAIMEVQAGVEVFTELY